MIVRLSREEKKGNETDTPAVLKATISGDGVWRIRRREKSTIIEVFKVEETGHGGIISDDFINWRIKVALKSKIR